MKIIFLINFLLNCFFFAASILSICGILGVTAGAHRLWAHKSYTASTGLRFLLMIFQTMAGQVDTKMYCMLIYITLRNDLCLFPYNFFFIYW